MLKIKKILAVIVSAALVAGVLPAAYVFADGTGEKVLTLGADLSAEQKDMMLQYFGIEGQDIRTLTVTNADERDYLSAYISLDEIGTRTYSCALVKPTSSGGIQVKTANLTWITSNMIASTLSTCGVVNCQVLAASPVAVSGTGALTGIIMAYESASGRKLNKKKVRAGTKELITTARIGDRIGPPRATLLVSLAKAEVIGQNVTSVNEITEIINDISVEYNLSLTDEDTDLLAGLLGEIADLDYDLDEMQETLDHVEENVVEEIEEEEAEESILTGTDDAALGEDAVFDSTVHDAAVDYDSTDSASDESAADEPASDESVADDFAVADSTEGIATLQLKPETEDDTDNILMATDDSLLSEEEPAETETEEEGPANVPADPFDIFPDSAGEAEAETEAAEETEDSSAEELEVPASPDDLFDILYEDGYSSTAEEDAEIPASSDDIFDAIFENEDSSDLQEEADAWDASFDGWDVFEAPAEEEAGVDAQLADEEYADESYADEGYAEEGYADEESGWYAEYPEEEAEVADEFAGEAAATGEAAAAGEFSEGSGKEAAAKEDTAKEDTATFTSSDLSFSPNGTTVDPDLSVLEIRCSSGDLTAGSGSLTLYDEDGTKIEQISMSGSQVEAYSDEVDVYLDTQLSGGSSYYVILSDDALRLDGDSLKATSASAWEFSTSGEDSSGEGFDGEEEDGDEMPDSWEDFEE